MSTVDEFGRDDCGNESACRDEKRCGPEDACRSLSALRERLGYAVESVHDRHREGPIDGVDTVG